MNQELRNLKTIDLLTRHLFHRSIGDGVAENELRRRGWMPSVAKVTEFAIVPFVAVDRFMAKIDDDDWDLPTTLRDVFGSAALSLMFSLPVVLLALLGLWLTGVRSWWLVSAIGAWPLSGWCIGRITSRKSLGRPARESES